MRTRIFTQTAMDDHSRFPKDSSSQEKHYDYDQLTSVSILLALLLIMNILYSEVVHPRGPAEGGYYEKGHIMIFLYFVIIIIIASISSSCQDSAV